MVILSAPVFDLGGVLVLNRTEDSRLFDHAKRLSRVPTLDGGAVLVDLGWSEADRTLRLVDSAPAPGSLVLAEYLARTYSALTCAVGSRLYVGAVASVRTDGGSLMLDFLVTDKLMEV